MANGCDGCVGKIKADPAKFFPVCFYFALLAPLATFAFLHPSLPRCLFPSLFFSPVALFSPLPLLPLSPFLSFSPVALFFPLPLAPFASLSLSLCPLPPVLFVLNFSCHFRLHRCSILPVKMSLAGLEARKTRLLLGILSKKLSGLRTEHSRGEDRS